MRKDQLEEGIKEDQLKEESIKGESIKGESIKGMKWFGVLSQACGPVTMIIINGYIISFNFGL